MKTSKIWLVGTCAVAVFGLAACGSSLKAPATADVAVSQAAVDNATSADGTEFAPEEMRKAREKLGWRHETSFAALVHEMVAADLDTVRREGRNSKE